MRSVGTCLGLSGSSVVRAKSLLATLLLLATATAAARHQQLMGEEEEEEEAVVMAMEGSSCKPAILCSLLIGL